MSDGTPPVERVEELPTVDLDLEEGDADRRAGVLGPLQDPDDAARKYRPGLAPSSFASWLTALMPVALLPIIVNVWKRASGSRRTARDAVFRA